MFSAGHTERAMLYHELEDGMYSVTSYFFAKVSFLLLQQGSVLLHAGVICVFCHVLCVWMFALSTSGPRGATWALCVHLGVRPAHLLAGRAQRGSGALPAQLRARVADGLLQPGHGSVCGRCAAHPADLSLHGKCPVHRLLFDGRLCHQPGEHVARWGDGSVVCS